MYTAESHAGQDSPLIHGNRCTAKRNWPLSERLVLEMPRALAVSEPALPCISLSSGSGSVGCWLSNSLPPWQHLVEVVIEKRSHPQCSQRVDCSKKLIGCVSSDLCQHVTCWRGSRAA